jgi:hypothetical protein
MGAAPQIGERGHPVFFFGRTPRYDRNYTGREPSSLFERIKSIAQLEAGEPPAPGVEPRISINETRVWLMTWGSDLHEWMQRNRDDLMQAAQARSLYPEQAIFALLDEALAAERGGSAAPRKKPPK